MVTNRVTKSPNLDIKNDTNFTPNRLKDFFFFILPFTVSGGRGSRVVKVSNRSSPVPLKTHRVGARCTLRMSGVKHLPVGEVWLLGEGVPAQGSSTSFDHGSKLRGLLPKALV
ncbi:hypothetical protein TNCV_562601 [Trichonephila clavipes]|nr:hypothetical protein TNCV_562601 [Trichonephila clavipes]